MRGSSDRSRTSPGSTLASTLYLLSPIDCDQLRTDNIHCLAVGIAQIPASAERKAPRQILPGSHRSSPSPSAEDLCRTLRALLLQYSSLPYLAVKNWKNLILFLSTMALRGKSPPHPHKSNNTCRPRSSADLPCRETLPHFHLSASVLVCVLFH